MHALLVHEAAAAWSCVSLVETVCKGGGGVDSCYARARSKVCVQLVCGCEAVQCALFCILLAVWLYALL